MIDFLVHEDGDSVGIIVVEGIQAGQQLRGWVMEGDGEVSVQTLNAIPIGHKIAIRDLSVGASVIKYGVDIGRAVAPIAVGEHLHVHNVKTRRW